MLGDTGNAAGYYKRLIQSYPNSDLIDQARTYLNQLGDTTSIDPVDISSNSDNTDNSSDSSSDNSGGNTGDGSSDNSDGSGE